MVHRPPYSQRLDLRVEGLVSVAAPGTLRNLALLLLGGRALNVSPLIR